jgi:hypothetical protein
VRDSAYSGELPDARHVYGRDYEGALRQAIWKNKAQEKYIRIRAWWSFNSAYRGDPIKDFNLPSEQEANLRRLLQLLDTNDPDTSITRAEILRELGQFDECLNELDQAFDDAYSRVVDSIKRLAKGRTRQVGTIG